MKLVINIPCYNEEATLPLVFGGLPNQISRISEIKVQIVDDGSVDETAEVAKILGCRVITHSQNLGLGHAFQTGVDAALESGCDIFVNIDADNQYPTRYISDLIQPILGDEAVIVIGYRLPWKVGHFSLFKGLLQWIGNKTIRILLNIESPDAVSGFRAYSRTTLEKLHVTSSYSYTLDTLVQAAHYGMRIKSVPIQTNPPTRKSRLATNVFQYIALMVVNFAQVMLIYQPRKILIWTILFPIVCMIFALLLFLSALL